MATVRERTNRAGKTFAVLFRHAGKQTSTTFPNRRDADQFARRVNALGPAAALAMLEEGHAEEWSVPVWVRHHVEHQTGITDGTRADYLTYVDRAIAPHLDMPLTSITREAVEKWVNALAASGLSGKSIRNRHSLLSAALTRAIRAGHLAGENPCRGVRLPRTEETTEKCYLTGNEYVLFLSCFPERWVPLVVTLFGTGLRIGEATALQVGDLDLDSHTPVLHVRRAWKHTDGNGHRIGPPKSRAGRRTVSLGVETVDALRPLVQGRAGDAWLFTGSRGGPVRAQFFRENVWGPAVELANGKLPSPKWRGKRPLPTPLGKRPTPHDARHTHASWQLADGVAPHMLQHRLGHESIQTTVNTYGHLMPDAHRIMAAVASRYLAGGTPAIEG